MRQSRSSFFPVFFSLMLQPNVIIMTTLCICRLEVLAFANSLGLGIFRRMILIQVSKLSLMGIAFLRIPPSSQVSVDSFVPSIIICFFKFRD